MSERLQSDPATIRAAMGERNGIYENLDEATYHRHPALSSTQARLLLNSPARYKYSLTHPQPRKDAYDLGTAVHTRVLGVGAEVVTYPDEHLTPSGGVSTKAATVAWAEEQRANGAVVIGRAQADQVNGMAEAVLADPEASGILEAIAGREVSVFAEVDGVSVRARFDGLSEQGAAFDLKTTADASPQSFEKSITQWGYHVQTAWYDSAWAAHTGSELQSFDFIAVEKHAPYLVGVYGIDFSFLSIGRELSADARALFSSCTATDTWPGYARTTLAAPTWYLYRHEERHEIQI